MANRIQPDRTTFYRRMLFAHLGQAVESTSMNFSPPPSLPPPSPSLSLSSPSEFSVTLKKDGQKSLGFSIVGGRNSSRGHCPLFIRSIAPNSIASEDGRLHSGDKISQINGKYMYTYNHVWPCILLLMHLDVWGNNWLSILTHCPSSQGWVSRYPVHFGLLVCTVRVGCIGSGFPF